MKVLLGATAALMLMAAPAFAQTLPPECSFTAPPTIPDGANATNAQMTQARTALEAWRTARQAEMTACDTTARALDTQAKAAAAAHNAALAETNATINRFAEENSEYGARGSTSGRRERGSITN